MLNTEIYRGNDGIYILRIDENNAVLRCSDGAGIKTNY